MIHLSPLHSIPTRRRRRSLCFLGISALGHLWLSPGFQVRYHVITAILMPVLGRIHSNGAPRMIGIRLNIAVILRNLRFRRLTRTRKQGLNTSRRIFKRLHYLEYAHLQPTFDILISDISYYQIFQIAARGCGVGSKPCQQCQPVNLTRVQQ